MYILHLLSEPSLFPSVFSVASLYGQGHLSPLLLPKHLDSFKFSCILPLLSSFSQYKLDLLCCSSISLTCFIRDVHVFFFLIIPNFPIPSSITVFSSFPQQSHSTCFYRTGYGYRLETHPFITHKHTQTKPNLVEPK